ncbi:MAG: hypothetical protein AAF572_26970 [Cyanobacteria bacterium P01_B01_bin.77]
MHLLNQVQSALAAALISQCLTSTNIQISTFTCDRYQAGNNLLSDTPGILFHSVGQRQAAFSMLLVWEGSGYSW